MSFSRFGQIYSLGLVSVALYILLSTIPLSCIAPPHVSSPADIQANKRACTAKGEVIISKDLLLNEPCAATALRLAALVATDEDCRAYYGDAGITVQLCPEPHPATDGGSK